MQNFRRVAGWVKTTVLFLAHSGPEFMKCWDDVGDPFVTVFRLSISCSSSKILALNVAIE